MNFAARISEAAVRFPERVAVERIRTDGRIDSTTYAVLDGRAGRIGGWLIERGIAPGDRVAILADNDAAWIAAYVGTLRIGAVAVPLDTAYKAAQVAIVVSNAGARMLFTTPRHLDTARAALATLGPAAADVTLTLLEGHAPDTYGPSDFDAPRDPPPIASVGATDAAVMLYTSGTTADPKGVVLTHANLDAEREAAFAVVHVDEHDAILGVLPLFHALAQMANLLLPLAVGARVVFLETISSTSLVEALGSRGITVFACVPQFFYLIHQRVMSEAARKGRLARAFLRTVIRLNRSLRDRTGLNPARRLLGRIHRALGSRMRLFVTGGSKFDPVIGRDLYGLGFTILNAYGLTETSGGATIVRPHDRFNASVGQPLPGVEIRIQREHEDADDGEVLIRGPMVMREYFRRPDATADALRDGWLFTGDLGRLDERGRLFITGRKKEIIVLSSGKNLYPEEIEAHYRQSAFIRELCVLGVSRPGEPASERLHAVVVPDQDVLHARGIVNVKELMRFEIEGLAVQLPAHKRILSYDISFDPLPRTTTGKIRRHEVQRAVQARATHAGTTEQRPLSDADVAWAADPRHANLLRAIARRTGREGVRPDANLELDLGLDSMERVELLTLLEQQEGTRVSAEMRTTIFTVRQLIEAVESAPSAAGASGRIGGATAEGGGELPWNTLLAPANDPPIAAELVRHRPFRDWGYFALVTAASIVARMFIRIEHEGREQLASTGPYIISPNHQAYLDPFFLAAVLPYRVFRQLFFVGAAEYFESPMGARFARSINLVPVDPDANLVSAMRAGAAGLRRGKILILFPEGERSIDGEVKTFKKGAAILSAHLDTPMVPVAMDGVFELWPRGRSFNWKVLRPWRRHRIRLKFGPPVRAERGRYVEGTAALRQAVVGMFDSIRIRPEGG
jgi:long-chain acyl-CoA synthetase